MRPVKLRTIVKGYAPTKTDFLFERRLNDYIYSVVSERSKGKPSLVFCRWADLTCSALCIKRLLLSIQECKQMHHYGAFGSNA